MTILSKLHFGIRIRKKTMSNVPNKFYARFDSILRPEERRDPAKYLTRIGKRRRAVRVRMLSRYRERLYRRLSRATDPNERRRIRNEIAC